MRKADHLRLRSLKTSLLIASMMLSKSAFGSDEAPRATESDLHKLEASPPTRAGGLVMFDYQAIKIKGYQPVDLVGFHLLNRFNDWLYVGVGGHAPLFKGEYGGFMAFDATVHTEQRLFGNWSASAGASLGGGGGGKTDLQAKTITGTGGFLKSYVGLGYRFNEVSVGLNYSKIRFTNSVIDGSQFGLYVRTPFSYSVAPYGSAGRIFRTKQESDQGSIPTHDSNDVIILGADNLIQINPQGLNKRTVNLVDAQYNHFLTNNHYLLFGGSVGYHGLAGYNQAYGGVGYKASYSRRFNIYSQIALGSGGYAPDKIDTGSGLLIYPKLSAEYRLTDSLGLSLSGGYLYAPRGTSRNMTLGAALVYRISPKGGTSAQGQGEKDVGFSGHRVHVFSQTQSGVRVGNRYQSKLKLLTAQVDQTIGDNIYVPIQGSIAYSPYLGYPGFGELLAGIGVQNKYSADDTFQVFAQLLVGTNIHGIIVKPAVGVNVGLTDRLAIYGQVGTTRSLDNVGLYPKDFRYRSTSVGLGVSYRFSLPM
jgi:hypothetical protein